MEKNFIKKSIPEYRQRTTMCIVHKGFRGFRAASPASILGGNLIGLKLQSLTTPCTQRCMQVYRADTTY